MHDPSKGRANSISGIPLAGTTAQIETGSVEPNRIEGAMAFQPEGKEELQETYFTAEEARLGENDASYVGTKDNEKWSEGLADECNPEDDDWSEGVLPETQPLHLVSNVPSAPDRADDMSEIELQPDQENQV